MEFANAIIAFTGISFLVYGFNSLTSKRMVNEFKRWGFSKYRKLISFLQILGAIGLILGLKFNLGIIFSPTFGVIAKKTQLHLSTIS